MQGFSYDSLSSLNGGCCLFSQLHSSLAGHSTVCYDMSHCFNKVYQAVLTTAGPRAREQQIGDNLGMIHAF